MLLCPFIYLVLFILTISHFLNKIKLGKKSLNVQNQVLILYFAQRNQTITDGVLHCFQLWKLEVLKVKDCDCLIVNTIAK